MRKLIFLALLVPAVAFASGLFDGTWKTRLDSMRFSGKPESYEISNGIYDCRSCAPPYKIKADGSDQPVPEHDYLDHQSVKVVSPSSIEITDKKAGKIMATLTQTVSADGSQLIGKFTSYVGEQPFNGTVMYKRVSPGAAGAHAISGSWMQSSVADMSDIARTVTLQSTPNGLKMIWNGQATDAKFDGHEYPSVGDPGKTMVSLKKLGALQFEETDRRSGKVFDIIVWTVAADGKTINSVDTDPIHQTTTTFILDKQP